MAKKRIVYGSKSHSKPSTGSKQSYRPTSSGKSSNKSKRVDFSGGKLEIDLPEDPKAQHSVTERISAAMTPQDTKKEDPDLKDIVKDAILQNRATIIGYMFEIVNPKYSLFLVKSYSMNAKLGEYMELYDIVLDKDVSVPVKDIIYLEVADMVVATGK